MTRYVGFLTLVLAASLVANMASASCSCGATGVCWCDSPCLLSTLPSDAFNAVELSCDLVRDHNRGGVITSVLSLATRREQAPWCLPLASFFLFFFFFLFFSFFPSFFLSHRRPHRLSIRPRCRQTWLSWTAHWPLSRCAALRHTGIPQCLRRWRVLTFSRALGHTDNFSDTRLSDPHWAHRSRAHRCWVWCVR